MDIYYNSMYLWLRDIKSFKADSIISKDEIQLGIGYLCQKGRKRKRFLLQAFVPLRNEFDRYPYMRKKLETVSLREKFVYQLMKNESFYVLWKKLKPKKLLDK